jgi:hypothetical protein
MREVVKKNFAGIIDPIEAVYCCHSEGLHSPEGSWFSPTSARLK